MSLFNKLRSSVTGIIHGKPTNSKRRPKKALWLIAPLVDQFARGEHPEQGILTCPQASARLRVAIAAMEWRRAGNEVEFLVPENAEARKKLRFNTDTLCVVHKFLNDSEYGPWAETCAAAKSNGGRLVVDICDSPFHDRPSSISRFYRHALEICDAVTVNSEKMAEVIAQYTSHRPFVIEDAVLGDSIKPHFAPGATLRLLWFGHPRNLPTLIAGLGSIVPFAKQRPCKLMMVTEPGCGAERLAEKIETKFAPALEAQFIPWSLEATAGALRVCDLVLIPSDPSNPFYAGASANRVIETLNAGRFPVASPLQSYAPFSNAAWLGADMIDGIRWALANPSEVLARILRGQALIQQQFTPEQIGHRWRGLLESISS